MERTIEIGINDDLLARLDERAAERGGSGFLYPRLD